MRRVTTSGSEFGRDFGSFGYHGQIHVSDTGPRARVRHAGDAPDESTPHTSTSLLGMSRKLFVGNLPYTCTNEDLTQHFSPYGEVASAKIIMDRETGRSRGFAFVEMATDEAGAAAMKALDGSQFGGRALAVREAVERQGGGGGGFGRGPRSFGDGEGGGGGFRSRGPGGGGGYGRGPGGGGGGFDRTPRSPYGRGGEGGGGGFDRGGGGGGGYGRGPGGGGGFGRGPGGGDRGPPSSGGFEPGGGDPRGDRRRGFDRERRRDREDEDDT
jgi:hypothetical protein